MSFTSVNEAKIRIQSAELAKIIEKYRDDILDRSGELMSHHEIVVSGDQISISFVEIDTWFDCPSALGDVIADLILLFGGPDGEEALICVDEEGDGMSLDEMIDEFDDFGAFAYELYHGEQALLASIRSLSWQVTESGRRRNGAAARCFTYDPETGAHYTEEAANGPEDAPL